MTFRLHDLLQGGSTARACLGIAETGTGASQLVQLDANGKLPAVDGSALTNLPPGSIGNGTITYAKIQNVATDKLLGRSTAGAGVVEEIALTAAGRALIDDADAAAQRTTLGLGTLATQSGTFSGTSSGTNTGDQTLPVKATGAELNTGTDDAKFATAKAIADSTILRGPLTGDVTTSGLAATIATAAVTLAKMANMATASLIYRRTAGAGVPEVNTLAQLKTDLALVKGDVGLGSVDNTADASKPVSTAQQTALDLKANLVSPSLTTPGIGVATGTSLAVTGAVTSSGTAGIGYASGAGGAVTQLTSKATTTPAINKMCGTITMNGAALAAATIVSFVVSNSLIGANDIVLVTHDSVGTLGAYTVQANTNVAATSFKISVRNNTAGSLSEAIVLRFAIIKAVTA